MAFEVKKTFRYLVQINKCLLSGSHLKTLASLFARLISKISQRTAIKFGTGNKNKIKFDWRIKFCFKIKYPQNVVQNKISVSFLRYIYF